MSRLTGRSESGGHWAAASALSFGVHALGLAWVLGIVPDLSPAPPPPPRQTVITLAPALELPPEAVDAAAPTMGEAEAPAPETAATAPEAGALAPAAAEAVAPTAEVPRLAGTEAPTASEAAPPAPAATAAVPRAAIAPVESLGTAAIASLAPVAPTAAPVGDPAPALPSVAPPAASAGAAEVAVLPSALPPAPAPAAPAAPAPAGPPPDPALVALIERIRARLDDACLVALPRPQADPLPPLVTTLTDRDATGAAFARAVLSDPGLPVEHRDLLVDARQCPALTFLRGAARYPAFALDLSLARSQLASGEVLNGRIDGAAGAYTSLLLVDDNGVVQDLRRFLRFSGGRAEFSIPMTRDGAPRETQALLIALATPGRPDAVARLAGRLAEEVFPALSAQVDARARLAVQAIDVR
ncbi:hypothetical protein JQC91_17325 [Jannaschia sp. Os4]|uniref:hypothetical protein n=1 Tax=Jannaschia sp. Os4 TaxID=2807617 RepID=UPI00193ADE0C|nr:hypothetical protein [Jannaschia sp. Os4]MBM2578071.1 hypothetical protein [Jannaschia sp. Os4]